MTRTRLVLVATVVAAAVGGGAAREAGAQDEKPKKVDKNSVRVSVPGCGKGYMFTATRRTEDTGGTAVPEGTHLRMNGKKDLMNEIKGHEGSRLEITGLIRRGQELPGGIPLGGGARIGGGGSMPGNGGGSVSVGRVGASPIMIDVEGYRVVPGDCPR